MSPLTALISLVVLLIAAVAGSTYAHYRQRAYVQRQQQVQYLRRHAEHYNEVASALAAMTTKREIAQLFNKFTVAYYEQILQIDPEAQFIVAALESAKAFGQQGGEQRAEGEGTTFNSEAEIARAQSYLNQAERLLRSMRDKGDIPSAVFDSYHQELRWLYLRCEVDSLINQGHLATQRKDRIKSLAFYQKAQNILKKSALADPRRQQLIKDIAQMLAKSEPSEEPPAPTSQRPAAQTKRRKA